MNIKREVHSLQNMAQRNIVIIEEFSELEYMIQLVAKAVVLVFYRSQQNYVSRWKPVSANVFAEHRLCMCSIMHHYGYLALNYNRYHMDYGKGNIFYLTVYRISSLTIDTLIWAVYPKAVILRLLQYAQE